jgi:hypothetical protein
MRSREVREEENTDRGAKRGGWRFDGTSPSISCLYFLQIQAKYRNVRLNMLISLE